MKAALAEQFVGTQEAESYRSFGTVRDIGNRALWGAKLTVEQLGVNDPLTHIKQYAEAGEAAMASIDEDLVTDLGERMLKPRFINDVNFCRYENDFLSQQGQFSMRAMTATTENKFGENVIDMQQYKRSKIESAEVERLNRWFDDAKTEDVFIVESLPLGNKERYSVVRIYRKRDDSNLRMYVIPLHNATVETFNQLHGAIKANVGDSHTELELLDKMYAHKPTEKFEDFLDVYVNAHDKIMEGRNPGEQFSFGISTRERAKEQDDIKMVRDQSGLRQIYHDTLRALAHSGGQVTPALLSIKEKLSLGLSMQERGELTEGLAKRMLDSVIQYMAATFNRASSSELNQLATSQNISEIYIAARQFGLLAREAGVHYGGACPSKTGNDSLIGSEINILESAFGSNEKWQWKSGICRVSDCPTRPGEVSVGPCDVCRRCQAIYDNGGQP